MRFVLIALIFVTPTLSVYGQTDEEAAFEKLQKLQQDINRISSELSTDAQRRDSLQEELKTSEVELGKLQREIAVNLANISRTGDELKTLRSERDTMEAARDKQQASISREMKTAWQLGQQGQLKVIMSQESPDTMARVLAYYRYFLEARKNLILSYRETLSQLENLEVRISSTLDDLKLKQSTLAEQQALLLTAQTRRNTALTELIENIDSKSGLLEQMQQDQEELEVLISAIKAAVAELEVQIDYQPFRAAKGKMPWPLNAKRSNNYGRPRNDGNMRWQGITIPAKAGTEVSAIHHGRVVYADWLRGSGLLLIIDHGDGYMSLYAHNQSLLREVGEWVSAGTPISTVGNSGGQEKSALYFEIRHQGKPTNPSSWCRD
ncbi:MAG: peptidoglycan DD-metalloendopeptidase family protein [Pseudomonadota bacterium]